MAGVEFFATRMGVRFFEVTMPALVDQLTTLNGTLKTLGDLQRQRPSSSEPARAPSVIGIETHYVGHQLCGLSRVRVCGLLRRLRTDDHARCFTYFTLDSDVAREGGVRKDDEIYVVGMRRDGAPVATMDLVSAVDLEAFTYLKCVDDAQPGATR